MKKFIANKKGGNRFIATVILICITLTVAIAISYWTGALTTSYQEHEKIEISNIYAIKEIGFYRIVAEVKNSGRNATILEVIINGKPSKDYDDISTSIPENGLTVASSSKENVIIIIDEKLFQSRTTLDMKFRSATGNECIQMLILP